MKDKQPEVQAKHHKKCVHCGRVFSAFGAYSHIKGRLNACMANHTKAAHPEFYKQSEAAVIRNEQRKKEVETKAVDAPVVKRPYKRRETPGNRQVNFCPCCGLNLLPLRVAAQMS